MSKELAKSLIQALKQSDSLARYQPEQEQESPPVKIAPETMKKFEQLLKMDAIKPADLALLTIQEQKIFSLYLGGLIPEKTGVDLDGFLKKIEAILLPSARKTIAKNNHDQITRMVANFLSDYGRMPNKLEIGRKTGLSRSTVTKHMKEFMASQDYRDKIAEYQFMKTGMMEKIMKAGFEGDIRAARLFMETVDKMAGLQTQGTTTINRQNNYIQINGVTLSMQQLTPEQLEQIKEMVNGVLEKKREA